MERGIEDLNLIDEEDEAFSLPEEFEEQRSAYDFCLVGCFLTTSVVHFPAMRNTLANIWHPLEGVQISDLGEKRFLFKIFNEIDITRVITGAPWTFNNHLLIFHWIQRNEAPMSIPLVYADWWVQIHDLPPGSFNDLMATQFGNFIGRLLEHDTKQILNGYRYFMRIRVQIDVRKPLKRRKKIMIADSKFTHANFKYEKLTLFCFLCGCLGHGESFCPLRLRIGAQEVEFGWGLALRAPVRKASTINSIWLRNEGENGFLGKTRLGQQSNQTLSQNRSHELWGNFSNSLGINLEGHKANDVENEDPENDRAGLIYGNRERYGKIQMGRYVQNVNGVQIGRERMGNLNGKEQANMECDLEKDPMSKDEGNKRQRSDSVLSNISNKQDLFEGRSGLFAHNQISAAAMKQADRSQ